MKPLMHTLSINNITTTFCGVDFNESMLSFAREYVGDIASFYLAPELTIPLPSSSLDFIFSFAVMIHNDEHQIRSIFKEFGRVLKPNGCMVHDFLNGDSSGGREQSCDALLKNFPMYPYSRLFVEEIGDQIDCGVSELRKNDKRISYCFKRIKQSCP